MIQRLRVLWNTYFDFHYGIAIVAGMLVFAVFITVRICLTRRRGESMKIRETGCIFLLCIYLTFLFGVTLFNRHPKEFYSMELTPLWSYQESLFSGVDCANWMMS